MNVKAIAIENKPFIIWQSTDEPKGALIIDENDIPQNIYGVCPWAIVGDQLVDRSADEMQKLEQEYQRDNLIDDFKQKIDLINNSTFEFNRLSFFMHEAARLLYSNIEKYTRPTDILTTAGTFYKITTSEIPQFIAAFDNAMLQILKQ